MDPLVRSLCTVDAFYNLDGYPGLPRIWPPAAGGWISLRWVVSGEVSKARQGSCRQIGRICCRSNLFLPLTWYIWSDLYCFINNIKVSGEADMTAGGKLAGLRKESAADEIYFPHPKDLIFLSAEWLLIVSSNRKNDAHATPCFAIAAKVQVWILENTMNVVFHSPTLLCERSIGNVLFFSECRLHRTPIQFSPETELPHRRPNPDYTAAKESLSGQNSEHEHTSYLSFCLHKPYLWRNFSPHKKWEKCNIIYIHFDQNIKFYTKKFTIYHTSCILWHGPPLLNLVNIRTVLICQFGYGWVY